MSTLRGETYGGAVVVAVRIAAGLARAVRSSLSCETNGEACCGLVMAAVSSSSAAMRRTVGPVAGIVHLLKNKSTVLEVLLLFVSLTNTV